MKHKLFLLAVLLMALALPQSLKAYDFEYTYQGKTLYYNIVDGNAQVTFQTFSNPSYSSLSGDLVIPATVTYSGTTYSVTSIDFSAFSYCSGLTSVTIPNSVTSIGEYAFLNCRDLTGSLTIPNSVTSIGHDAFSGCSGLTSVTIPNSVTDIGDHAFAGCSGLTSVTIPNSVTSIGYNAFYGVRHIEYYGSASGSPWGARLMNGYTEGDFVYSDNTKTNLHVYIGIGGNVTILNSVTSIGNSAFSGCSGLTSVTIPNSVTSIGFSAFYYCSGLTSVTIPNSVTSIGDDAFYYCSGLTTVNFNATNCTTMGSNSVFGGCTNLATLNIGENVTKIPNYVFRGCSGLTSVIIPNSVTNIGSFAFAGCSGLTSVIIGSGVTSINSYAFNSCKHLVNLISRAVYPPSCGNNVFNYIPQYCTLMVPCGSRQYYNVTSPWNTIFQLINEDCESIDDASADIIHVSSIDGRIVVEGNADMTVSVYDMMGHLIRNESLPTGVYMVKVGSLPAHKVVVIR